MKFEKRADGGEVTPASSETPETGKKPVIIYILILFLAAFLLMFLSMLSHQRSNTEALGQLQNSVSAIQEIQATQEQIIELQKRLDETEAERDEAKEELKVISDSISDLEKTSQAPFRRSATSIWTSFCPAPIRKALRLRPSGIRN